MTLVKFLQVPHTCGRLEQLGANKYILIELLRVSNIYIPGFSAAVGAAEASRLLSLQPVALNFFSSLVRCMIDYVI